MSFDWREYLELAKTIKDLSSQRFSKEASQRSAVSRAYYSAYGFALRYAERCGFRRKKRSEDHRELAEFFEFIGMEKVSGSLKILRMLRNMCDYENSVKNLNKHVETSIELAEKIIQILSQKKC